MGLEVLGQASHLSVLRALPPASSGIEHTHLARVAFGDGITRNAYVKIYRDDDRGLVNEALGFILAEALGLDVPGRGAILQVPKAAVPSPRPWMHTVPGDVLFAWCTSDLDAPSAKIHFRINCGGRGARAAKRELKDAPKSADVVSFDEWVANVDRNLGNLVRLGKKKYALIDHGQILTGPRWTKEALDPSGVFRNVLKDDVIGLPAQHPDFRSAIVASAARHAPTLGRVSTTVQQWARQLLEADEAAAVWDFLEKRADTNEVRKRNGMLL